MHVHIGGVDGGKKMPTAPSNDTLNVHRTAGVILATVN
jgi:hypothetical protein